MPEWSRMMSERDDVRGRRTDPRLLGGDVGLVRELERRREMMMGMGLSAHEFNLVCAPNNPYEALAQSSAWGSLSAVALGHLDFLLKPVTEYLKPKMELRFVDLGSICGGFSRYILWRANRVGGSAKGWYLGCPSGAERGTLDSADGLDIGRLSLGVADDSLTEFGAGSPTKPDVLEPATVEAFIEFVKSGSNAAGVDLVVGESGRELPDFGVDLERRQYAFILAQSAIALRVLRAGGTFVFRMADTTTPLSAEILFLLHACFERMAVVRSLASRPTSTERFIVCNHVGGESRWVASHFLAALARMRGDQFKLSHLVSWTRVSAERQFIDKIAGVNVTLAQSQLAGLKYAGEHSSSVGEFRPSRLQSDVAERCLSVWDLPLRK
ncbi:hypothetical protein IW152_003033 [Coemansia sp. BCRC 34962]|nr:hypothetical protein IW152_003033 [Coemansia sp. BCRC 34962]